MSRLVDDELKPVDFGIAMPVVRQPAEPVEHDLLVLDRADGDAAAPFQIYEGCHIVVDDGPVERAELSRQRPLRRADAVLAQELAWQAAGELDAGLQLICVVFFFA